MDFSAMVTRLRDTDDVMLVICGNRREEMNPLIIRPVPLILPSLRTRGEEVQRVVDEFARDALTELTAGEAWRSDVRFTSVDRQWVIDRSPLTLDEIEKSTLRILALKMSKSIPRAARRLRMTPVSLARWLDRRRPLPSPDLVSDADIDAAMVDDDGDDDGEELKLAELAELEQDLDASFQEEADGKLIDLADFIADLKAHR